MSTTTVSTSLSINQQRVDEYLRKVDKGLLPGPVPTYVMAKPFPPLTAEERKYWDAIVIKNYESPKR